MRMSERPGSTWTRRVPGLGRSHFFSLRKIAWVRAIVREGDLWLQGHLGENEGDHLGLPHVIGQVAGMGCTLTWEA